MKLKIAGFAAICLAGTATISLLAVPAPALSASAAIEAPVLATIAPGTLRYWASGEFTREGKPVKAPHVTVQMRRPITIMVHQVSVAEYRRCASEKACPPLADNAASPDLPAVFVSWRDAQSYAAWLTGKLGAKYRLPTDEEWTYAAASRAPDETPVILDSSDPAQAWLSRYQREAELDPLDKDPKPIGHFGRNENGLVDVAGNVWEWTDSCFTRSTLDSGAPRVVTENCGVRVVEGRHRAYVTDFIRDARGGGCVAGTPPSNLGFRLVRENARSWWLF